MADEVNAYFCLGFYGLYSEASAFLAPDVKANFLKKSKNSSIS
jgi:hypothetical protein